MFTNISKAQLLAISVILVMLGLALVAALLLPKTSPLNTQPEISIMQSASEQEFRAYVQKSLQMTIGGLGMGSGREVALSQPASLDMFAEESISNGSSPERYSQTNVQVMGIDEADIVKTNGNEIFYSNAFSYTFFERPVDLPTDEMSIMPVPEDRIGLPQQPTASTQVISAFPVEDLVVESEIEQGGKLLLSGNTMVVFSEQKITGYNISDVTAPEMTWEHTLEDSWIDTSRLLDGNILVVAKNYLSTDFPCPMPLMDTVRIACTSIYHPSVVVSSDTLYIILKINPMSGEVTQQLSFTGSSSQSVVYVSPENMYITYSHYPDQTVVMTDFFSENSGLLPAEYQQRLSQLRSYDLSNQAKLVEYEQILNEYKLSLSSDLRLQFEQDLNNKLQEYAQARIRDVEKTVIAKVNIDTMQISQNGEVPGTPLNQFSLDEHNGNLRIVTTVGGSFMLPTESVNDLYVLNQNLETIGRIQNLAQDERVYSARFIGDKAYVVTFKQIDPFFVFDLSNPSSPQVAGELKIPGYSSYLHPLTENIVLGVGREDAQVKLSMFDVSNKNNPIEVNKYLMDQTWTEVEGNHHAFLQDERHQVFFLPTSQGGFVFSYENNEIALVRTVAGNDIQRALFINDFLYIIGRENITVLNEEDWSTVSTLAL